MKIVHSLLLVAIVAPITLLLSSCGSGGSSGNSIKVAKTKGFNPNHGPFDSNGNYREEWADSPPRRIYVDKDEVKHPTVAYTPPKKEEIITRPPIVVYQPPVTQPRKPKQTTYTPKKRPTTRPVVVKKKPIKRPVAIKVKPKAKAPIIHVVKKGDTLYGLGRRYKSSVKTIMSANSLKGSNIRIGQVLRIPRY